MTWPDFMWTFIDDDDIEWSFIFLSFSFHLRRTRFFSTSISLFRKWMMNEDLRCPMFSVWHCNLFFFSVLLYIYIYISCKLWRRTNSRLKDFVRRKKSNWIHFVEVVSRVFVIFVIEKTLSELKVELSTFVAFSLQILHNPITYLLHWSSSIVQWLDEQISTLFGWIWVDNSRRSFAGVKHQRPDCVIKWNELLRLCSHHHQAQYIYIYLEGHKIHGMGIGRGIDASHIIFVGCT